MSRYQLTCTHCGDPIRVGIAQAGATIPCPACGGLIDIPGTKQLRALPEVADPADDGKGRPRNRPASEGGVLLYRLMLASLLLASFLGLGYGTYLAYARWNAPIEFGHTAQELYTEFYEQAMKDSPATVWDHYNYLIQEGIPEPQPPIYFVISRQFEEQKPWMIGSLVGGGLAFLCFLGLSLAGPRRQRRG